MDLESLWTVLGAAALSFAAAVLAADDRRPVGKETSSSASRGLKTAPLLRGALWWVGGENREYDWTRRQFAEAIKAQREVGFNLLWLMNMPHLFERALEADKTGRPRDIPDIILDIADAEGMKAIIELPQAGWYGKTEAKKIIESNENFIRRFHERYGKHPSFHGWYLNYEINPIFPNEKEESEFWRQVWGAIVRHCHRVAPGSIVTISPFFLLDDESRRGFNYLTPEQYDRWWTSTLKATGIDVVMLQDSGEHLTFFTLEQREPYWAAFASACHKAGAQFWLNVETGEAIAASWEEFIAAERKRGKPWDVSWRVTPIAWLERKLDLAARYATNIVNWGYFPYQRPDGTPEARDAYRQYKAYYERISRDFEGCKPSQ